MKSSSLINWILPSKGGGLRGKNLSDDFLRSVEKADKFLRAKRYDECITLSEELVEEYSFHVPLLRVYGYALLQSGREEDALKIFKGALRYDDEKERAHVAVGEAYEALDQSSSAEKSYRKAIRKGAKLGRSVTLLSTLLASKSRVRDEEKLIMRALKSGRCEARYIREWIARLVEISDRERAIQVLNDYLSAKNEEYELGALLAKLYVEHGDFEKAKDILARFEPEDGKNFEWAKTLCFLGRSAYLYPSGWSKESSEKLLIEMAKEFIESRPGSAEGYFELGRILKSRELLTEAQPFQHTPLKNQALDYFLLAAARAPDSLHIQLAPYRMLQAMGERQGVVELGDKLIENFPDDMELRLDRIESDLFSSSLEDLTQVLSLIRDDCFQDKKSQSRWLSLQAHLFIAGGESEKALPLLIEAIDLQPGDLSLVRELITVQVMTGRLDEARKNFSPLHEKSDDVPWIKDFHELLSLLDESPPARAQSDNQDEVFVSSSDTEEVIRYSESGRKVLWIIPEGEVSGLIASHRERFGLALNYAVGVSVSSSGEQHEIEDRYRIGVSVGATEESLRAVSKSSVCIGVGAGLGNIIQCTPLIRAVSKHLGHPIDVFCMSSVPGVETLFGESPWVNMVFGDVNSLLYRRYKKIFVTGSVGHAIPPVFGDSVVVQRRLHPMMERCRTMHESQYNFLGIELLLKDFQKAIGDEEKFFIRNLNDEVTKRLSEGSSRVIACADGKVPGKWQKREWEYFEELGAALKEKSYTVQSFGLKGQHITGTEDKTGTSLRQCFFDLSKVDLFIGSDGGLFHVSEALGLPTICIFGPTSVTKNGPGRGSTLVLHRELNCSPCQWKLDFVQCDNNRCMKEISVSDVLNGIDLLTNGGENSKINPRSILQRIIQHEADTADNPYRDEVRAEKLHESVEDFFPRVIFIQEVFRRNLSLGRTVRCEQILELIRTGGLPQVEFELESLSLLEAELRFYEKDFDKSYRILSSIQPINGSSADRKNYSQIKLLILKCLLKLERYDEVTEIASVDYHEHGSHRGEHYWLVGNAYRAKGEWESARESFQSGLELGHKRERFEQALQSLEKNTIAAKIYKERGVSSGKKRIVLFAHHHLTKWQPHGGEFSMHEIMQRLRATDEYELLVVVANSKNSEIGHEVTQGLEYIIASQYRYSETVKNVLENYKPDLALMWGPHSMKTAPICKEYGIPSLLFVRYWKVVCDAPYDRDVLNDSPTRSERETFGPLYSSVTEIITNAEHVSRVVEKRYGVSSKCSYVPVQSPPESYSPLPMSKRKYVTLINPRKAEGEKILRELALRLPEIPFQAIGEPSIALPNNVKVLPYSVRHYTETLRDTRLLLFPFGEEPCGTGRVVFEAFYSEVPVIGPRRGGLPEVIPEKWLIESNEDIESWERLVAELWSNPPSDLKNFFSETMERFDPEKNLQIIDGVIRSLLSDSFLSANESRV